MDYRCPRINPSKHNLDCKQVAWVHDEIQIETRKEHADELGKLRKQAIRNSEKKV